MLMLATMLWDDATAREERSLALAVCRHRRHHAFQDRRCLDIYRRFIVDGAWWDLVDETSRLVGELLDTDAEGVTGHIRAWATVDDLWQRRAAIICQRHRGSRTDRDLLVDTVTPNLGDREFFIRKGIGWALRQYARVEPQWVAQFVATHEMSGLSRREALKHVGPPADVAN
jgi:3-methyladenine DNA glycosylase AlkD